MTEPEQKPIVPDEEIAGIARACIKTAKDIFDVDLAFSEGSLAEVDDLITTNWGDGPPAKLDNMVVMWGAFVGECFRSVVGGRWRLDDEMGFILEDFGIGRMHLEPFALVRKRFLEGATSSLANYLQALKLIIAEERKRQGDG